MKAEFLILFFFYLVSIFSTLGYGLYFQKITNPTINKKCLGYSGIIGVFFLTIYSYFSNFFYEHGIHHNLIILVVGLLLFYLSYRKKLFVDTELKVLLTIFSRQFNVPIVSCYWIIYKYILLLNQNNTVTWKLPLRMLPCIILI